MRCYVFKILRIYVTNKNSEELFPIVFKVNVLEKKRKSSNVSDRKLSSTNLCVFANEILCIACVCDIRNKYIQPHTAN